ncbi:MAG: hypothetical protein ACMUIP_10765 [bacterium]
MQPINPLCNVPGPGPGHVTPRMVLIGRKAAENAAYYIKFIFDIITL